jgi:hypothetical protein
MKHSSNAHLRLMPRCSRSRVVVTASAAMLIAFAPGAWAGDLAGQVEQVRGEAVAEAQGTQRPLVPSEQVFVGDLVRTGEHARLGLRLGKATTVKLGALTRLKIDRYIVDAGGEFDLGSGSVQFEGASKSHTPDLKFKSVYGLIAVRGTRFYAGMSRGKFGVLVGTGRVQVTAGGRTVIVGPRQGTDIAAPGARPSTPKRWANRRIADMVRRFQ